MKVVVVLLGISVCVLAMSVVQENSRAAANRLDMVRERGVLRVGTNNTVPPMNYINDAGEWVGFDIDLSSAIANRLGVKVERVLVNNKTRVAFLANGTVDMVVSSMSHTRGRDDSIDYAEPPYLWTGKIAYAKKDRFQKRQELGGKRVAVVQGSNAWQAVQDELAAAEVEPAQILSFQTNADCFLALKQDKVDAYIQDDTIVAGVVRKEGVDYEAVGGRFSPGLYGIGVPENDSNWRDAVSFVLQDLMLDGTYQSIYETWFGKDGAYPLALESRPLLPTQAFGKDAWFAWPR